MHHHIIIVILILLLVSYMLKGRLECFPETNSNVNLIGSLVGTPPGGFYLGIFTDELKLIDATVRRGCIAYTWFTGTDNSAYGIPYFEPGYDGYIFFNDGNPDAISHISVPTHKIRIQSENP